MGFGRGFNFVKEPVALHAVEATVDVLPDGGDLGLRDLPLLFSRHLRCGVQLLNSHFSLSFPCFLSIPAGLGKSILFRIILLGTGLASLLVEVFVPQPLMDLTILNVAKVHVETGGVEVSVRLGALHDFNITSRLPFVNLIQHQSKTREKPPGPHFQGECGASSGFSRS